MTQRPESTTIATRPGANAHGPGGPCSPKAFSHCSLFVASGPSLLFAEDIALLGESLAGAFSGKVPTAWGEQVPGVRTHLDTTEKVLALTLDACGSASSSGKGNGYDRELLDFLVKERIPATLFINARWIDANPRAFRALQAEPLFTIGNHGMFHKPASINGRSAYGIQGTLDIQDLVREIEGNAQKIEGITGKRPVFYRSGTAFYDEYAVQIAERLGHEVIGFSVLGDAGATFSAQEVERALLSSKPGDIIIVHMNHPESGTRAGLMAAIPELKRRGFRFVSL